MKIRTVLFNSLFIAFITAAGIFQTNAQSAGQPYIVQQGDWLSKIADSTYGNPHLYYQIVEGTNDKALSDKSYQSISSVNNLTIGQKLWIPDDPSLSNETDEVKLVSIPKTDCEIRVWYNYQVVAISILNERWIGEGISLENRATKAYKLRHNARVNARFMMQNKEAVKQLQRRDMEKYGNPDGPTFEYLLKKNLDNGRTKEESFQKIIESSSRVNPVYNSECL
ncbi:MAG: LysM peptidoglycan-binding domain-containing protein [Bacteroidetes bacterium]|nr:LysM peptidoglycan-binding domain-containing protein [Bacteroidota bacterium]